MDVSTINEHLKNIYKSHELKEEATIGKFPIVQTEGKREVKREVNVYNLDVILSVGYRVNSSKATQFRIWATSVLKEYIIKGFTMDDERMKNGQHFGKDYLQEGDIKKLERTIGAYFDYIERIIENRQELSMKDVSESVNKFLEFNEFQGLEGKGLISHIEAKEKASKEYDEFNKIQKIESDFDKEMKKLLS